MNAVDIEAEVEAIAHLDFDPVCDVVDITTHTYFRMFSFQTFEKCQAPATWALICKSCGLRSFSCDRHAHSGKEETYCGRCQLQGPFDETVVAVRLDGRS